MRRKHVPNSNHSKILEDSKICHFSSVGWRTGIWTLKHKLQFKKGFPILTCFHWGQRINEPKQQPYQPISYARCHCTRPIIFILPLPWCDWNTVVKDTQSQAISCAKTWYTVSTLRASTKEVEQIFMKAYKFKKHSNAWFEQSYNACQLI